MNIKFLSSKGVSHLSLATFNGLVRLHAGFLIGSELLEEAIGPGLGTSG